MRRATSIKPHLKVRLRLLGVVLLVVLVWYGAAALDAKIQPSLQELAEYESRAVTVEVMSFHAFHSSFESASSRHMALSDSPKGRMTAIPFPNCSSF